MARKVDYKCPECHKVFEFLHHPNDEPPPDYCPLCKAFVGDTAEKQPVFKISIGTAKGKVPDQVYRNLEDSSAARAQEAADLVGANVAEMSAIKVTNLKDNSREGDVAAVTPPPSVSAQELTVPGVGGPQFQAMNVEQVQAMQQTARSLPAAKAVRDLNKTIPHRQLIAQKTAVGNMGSYK